MASSRENILHAISLVIIIINFFIIILIGIISTKQLKSSNKIEPIFKNLFHVSWIISSIGVLFFISYIGFYFAGVESCVLGALGSICTYLSAYNILLILIYRLYFSFKDSIFTISKTTKCILITLYSFTLLLFTYISIFYIVLIVNLGCSYMYSPSVILSFELNGVPIPIYILTTIITIIIFAKKLLKLTTFRQNTVSNQKSKAPSLKTYQIKMIENATRYVSLLTMGIFSTCCSTAFIWIIWMCLIYRGLYEDVTIIIFVVLSIDAVINIIGLYMQFPFSVHYYEKYCKYLHLCWRYLLTKKATNVLMKRYKNAENEVMLEMVETNEQS
eukprot:458601_1